MIEKVIIRPRADRKVRDMLQCSANQGLEWLAYLVGEPVGHNFIVRDLVFPKQTRGAGFCRALEYPKVAGKMLISLGTIHCHPWTSDYPQFSGIDQDGIWQNHTINVVVSSDHHYSAIVRTGSWEQWSWQKVPVLVKASRSSWIKDVLELLKWIY